VTGVRKTKKLCDFVSTHAAEVHEEEECDDDHGAVKPEEEHDTRRE